MKYNLVVVVVVVAHVSLLHSLMQFFKYSHTNSLRQIQIMLGCSGHCWSTVSL